MRPLARARCCGALLLVGAVILAACAGPSPDLTPAASDASATATAADDAGEQDVSAAAPQTAAEDESAAAEESDATSPADAETEQPVEPTSTATAPAETGPPSTAPASAPIEEAVAEPQPTVYSAAPAPSVPEASFAGRRPYVVIRFAESSVDFERPLADAVKRAIDRKPNVAFDLVAVTPRASTAEDLAELSQQAGVQAAAVMKSLSALGIGPDRVRMMAWTGQPTDVNEIRLYIR